MRFAFFVKGLDVNVSLFGSEFTVLNSFLFFFSDSFFSGSLFRSDGGNPHFFTSFE